MTNRVKVSILVPTYGAEKFAEECLESLVHQTLKDIEIICINDGSKDKSLDILKRYAKQDKRVTIIDKPNTGYGDSMNRGLAIATGEYIGIVEPDDFIDTDAFEKLYKIAIEKNAEVVKSNYYEYFGETGKENVSSIFALDQIGRVIDPRDEHDIFYQPPCIWAAIYRRSFLVDNGIDFLPTPGASYQDTGFNLKVWSLARRAYFVKRAFLHYRQDNSNSSVKDERKVFCVKEEHDEVERFLTEKGLIEELGPIVFTCRFGSYIWNLHRLSLKPALKFAKVIKEDYSRAKKNGHLDSNKLDAVGKHNARLVAIKHPKLYIFFKPVHNLRNFIRNTLKKIARRLSPSYRKRLKILDTITELDDMQCELANKITELELKKRKQK